jgi:hypothetical protein
MHGPINVKTPNNISKLKMGFNSAFKGLITVEYKVGLSINKFCHSKICRGMYKVKVKFTKRQAMKAQRGSRSIALRFL